MTSKWFSQSQAVFLLAVLVFLFAPVYQSLDSRYTLMVSQNLIEKGSFRLNTIKGIEEAFPYYKAKGNFEFVNDNLYYLFPNASSVLSVPYVAYLNRFGMYLINPDGSFNTDLEVRMQRGLASILMAALAAVFFNTARLWLPAGWSWLVALTAAFGTQIFSTVSRGLWSHCWGIFLLGIALYLVARRERGFAVNPILLGTVLAWSYLVRPTFSVSIILISLYLLLRSRKLFIPYALTGLCWLGLFIGYSWYNYSKLLPTYFAGGRLGADTFWTAFAGNLVSPSRGALVYSPFIVVVMLLVVRYHRSLAAPVLALIAGMSILLHLAAISTFPHWWAGHCYGPRLMSDTVPWIVLLGIFGIDAMRRSLQGRQTKTAGFSAKFERALLSLLAVVFISFSIFAHGVGAFRPEVHNWNLVPESIDLQPERLWYWKVPQLLSF